MDLNLHSFILAVAVVLVLLILADGCRRMMAARREYKRSSLSAQPIDFNEELELLRAELPNGGARSVDLSISSESANASAEPIVKEIDFPQKAIKTPISEQALSGVRVQSAPAGLTEANDDPTQEANEQIPMLMESVHLGAKINETSNKVVLDKTISDQIASEEGGSNPGVLSQFAATEAKLILDDLSEEPICAYRDDWSTDRGPNCPIASNNSELQFHEDSDVKSEFFDSAMVSTQVLQRPRSRKENIHATQAHQEKRKIANTTQTNLAATTQIEENVGERLADRPPAEEVLVIHVFSKEMDGFALHLLFRIMQLCDLRHGEMGIFHRFERENAQGKIQFSVANVIKPGAFDLQGEAIFTPGVALFMSLPGPEKPLEAFDAMAELAQAIARNLKGVVKDEALSVMTLQTLEHSRQRIREFHRRQKVARCSLA